MITHGRDSGKGILVPNKHYQGLNLDRCKCDVVDLNFWGSYRALLLSPFIAEETL